MQSTTTMPVPHYDPNRLLDALLDRLGLKNDAALSRVLDVARPILASIRQRLLGVGAWLLLRMAEASKLSVEDLRRLMGDQRARLRVGSGHLRGEPKRVAD